MDTSLFGDNVTQSTRVRGSISLNPQQKVRSQFGD
jgi:hypothetical protein